jgi:lysine-N-methylase
MEGVQISDISNMTNSTQNKKSAPKYFSSAMLVPKYVTKFQCLGGECPDTCCSTWSINVDKATFQRYRRETHPEIKPLLQRFLVQEDKDSYARHGKLKLRPSDSHCGLHTSEGMCPIQQKLGEDALSDTCYIYPRYVVQFGDQFEQSLTLSCPEAARLALTQDDAFEFVSADFTTRLATTTVVASVRGFPIEAMDEVRVFLIQLFQTPSLSNTERLVTVGWICQQIDALVDTNAQPSVNSLLEEMRGMIESGSIHATVGQLDKQQATSVTLFSILFGVKPPPETRGNQRDVLDRVRSGLGITSELSLVKISDNYVRGSQLLAADSGTCEKLVSRHLLNDLVRETFPWTQALAMAHYRRLLTRYGILRLMLAGMAAEQGSALSEEEIVRTIQVFCRIYQHNMAFSKQAEELLVKSEWTRLDRLYALLN